MTFAEDWNTITTDEDVHASDPTQEKEDDAFFDQAHSVNYLKCFVILLIL